MNETEEYIEQTNLHVMLPLNHQAHTSPKSGSVAVALPNQSLALSITRSTHKTHATIHQAVLGLPQHVHSFHFPQRPQFHPNHHRPQQARGQALLQEGGFSLCGPSPRSLFHSGGFGWEDVVPWVGLTRLVEQRTGFDAPPVCLFESPDEDPEGGLFGAGFDSGNE